MPSYSDTQHNIHIHHFAVVYKSVTSMITFSTGPEIIGFITPRTPEEEEIQIMQ
jgi:hypothetical protein